MPRVTFPNGDSIEFPDGTDQQTIQRVSADHWDQASQKVDATGLTPPEPGPEPVEPNPNALPMMRSSGQQGPDLIPSHIPNFVEARTPGLQRMEVSPEQRQAPQKTLQNAPGSPEALDGMEGASSIPGPSATNLTPGTPTIGANPDAVPMSDVGWDAVAPLAVPGIDPGAGLWSLLGRTEFGKGMASMGPQVAAAIPETVAAAVDAQASAPWVPQKTTDTMRGMVADPLYGASDTVAAISQIVPPAAVQRIEDIHGLADFGDWLASQLGQQAMVLPGIAASTAAGGPAGGLTAATILQTGMQSRELREMGESDPGKAVAVGLVTGAMEFLPVGRLLSRTKIAGPGFKKWAVEKLKHMGQQSVEESLTEGLQTFTEKLGLQWANENYDAFTPETWSEIMNAMAAGGAVGGVMGAGGSVQRTQDQAPQEPVRPEAPPQQPGAAETPPPARRGFPPRRQGVQEPPPWRGREPIPAEGDRRAADRGTPDRRMDLTQRRRVSEMTEEEAKYELLVDHKLRETTGVEIGNDRAYFEAEADTPDGVTVWGDVDGLGWWNDNASEATGNELLGIFAEEWKATRDEMPDAVRAVSRIGGDEFAGRLVRGSEERFAARLQERLAGRELDVTLKDGTPVRGKIAGSFGVGRNYDEASVSGHTEKERREFQGLRSAKGREPVGLVRETQTDGQPPGVDQGSTPQEVTPAPPTGKKSPWQQTKAEYIDSVDGWAGAARDHKNFIKKALEQGQPVPPEVLKDYPDLAPAAAAAPAEPPSAVPVEPAATPEAPPPQKEWLRRRLNGAKDVLTREAKKLLGNPVFDFENHRLVSEDGKFALQWRPKEKPEDPSTGTVTIVNLEQTKPPEPASAAKPPETPPTQASSTALKQAKQLRNQAAKIRTKAEEKKGQDRQTHTPRMARHAAGAIESANSEIALADTLEKVAELIESGRDSKLAGIKSRAALESLERVLRSGKYKIDRKNDTPWDEGRDRPATAEDAEAAVYPWPRSDSDISRSVARDLEKVQGGKNLAKRWEKIANSGDRKPITDLKLLQDTEKKLGKNWRYADDLADVKRLRSLGINEVSELREALKDLVEIRAQKKGIDKSTAAELSLAGRKIPGFFPTPPAVIERMLEAADIQPTDKVLEPSAGKGDIAQGLLEAGVESVDAIEINNDLREILKGTNGVNIVGGDFLNFQRGQEGEYDKIVMNPPFENGQDMDHVRHAFDLMKPGGRIVAIMSEGSFSRGDKKATGFREWLEEVGGTSEKLPAGSFMEHKLRKTGTATRLVVIDKPGEVAAPAEPEPISEGRAIFETRDDSINYGRGAVKELDAFIAKNADRTVAEATGHPQSDPSSDPYVGISLTSKRRVYAIDGKLYRVEADDNDTQFRLVETSVEDVEPEIKRYKSGSKQVRNQYAPTPSSATSFVSTATDSDLARFRTDLKAALQGKPEPTESKAPESGEKEPWQMTKDEFGKREWDRYNESLINERSALRKGEGNLVGQFSKYKSKAAGLRAVDAELKKITEERNEARRKGEGFAPFASSIGDHYGYISRAIRDGKDVPMEVLEQYPALLEDYNELRGESTVEEDLDVAEVELGSPGVTPDPFAPGYNPHVTPTVLKDPGKVETTTAPKVIKTAARAAHLLGVKSPIRVGLKKKTALGVFKVRPEVIRIKRANDIETVIHELGHAIEKSVFGWVKGSPWVNPTVNGKIQRELAQLGVALYGKKKPAGGYKREGWAEFMRLWMTQPDTAKKNAPELFNWFENEFLAKQDRKAREAMNAAQVETLKWFNQGSVNRIKNMMVDTASLSERAKRGAEKLKKATSKETLYEILDPLYEIAQAAEETLGRDLSPSENPYIVASALRKTHHARVKEMIDHAMVDFNGNAVGAPLKDIRPLVRGKMPDFWAYMYAKRAIALITDPNGPRDPGITLEDAAQAVAELETPEFQRAAQIVYRWSDQLLDYASQASPNFSSVVEKIRERDPGNYVPLQRVFDEIADGYRRGPAKGSVTARLKGSGRQIKDPLQQMIANASRLVRAAHTERVMDALFKLEEVEGMGRFVEKIPKDKIPATKMTLEQLVDDLNQRLRSQGALVNIEGDPSDVNDAMAQMLTFFQPASRPKSGKRVVVRWNPTAKTSEWYEVNEELFKMLETMEPFRLGAVGEWLAGKPAAAFRTGTTGLRASFQLIANPIRDFQTFYMQTQTRASAPRALLAWADGLRSAVLYRTLGYRTPELDAFIRLGGEMAQPLAQDINYTRRTARRMHEGRVLVHFDPRNWFDLFRDFIQFPELAPRIAELKVLAKEHGIDITQPLTEDQSYFLLLAAKQVTTDFTAEGKMSRVMNRIVPFFNAQIQGPRASLRAAKRNPVQFLARGLQLGVLTVALWLLNKDEDWYKELPWKDRLLYWHFETDWPEPTIIRIPRAFELGLTFAALPEALVETWYSNDPEAALEWANQFAGAMNPFDLPVLAKEGAQQLANKDFFSDVPIVPMGEDRKPAEEQYAEYTSRAAIKLGDLFNVSPRRLEHAIRGIGGPVSLDVLSVLGVGPKDRVSESEAADLPVIGRIFSRGGKYPSRSLSVNRVYEELEKARLKQNSSKHEETPEERQRRLLLNDAADAISALSFVRRYTKENSKRQEINRLRIQIAQDALRAIKEPLSGGARAPFKTEKKKAEREKKRIKAESTEE